MTRYIKKKDFFLLFDVSYVRVTNEWNIQCVYIYTINPLVKERAHLVFSPSFSNDSIGHEWNRGQRDVEEDEEE